MAGILTHLVSHARGIERVVSQQLRGGVLASMGAVTVEREQRSWRGSHFPYQTGCIHDHESDDLLAVESREPSCELATQRDPHHRWWCCTGVVDELAEPHKYRVGFEWSLGHLRGTEPRQSGAIT
jgi:hypothetical protein